MTLILNGTDNSATTPAVTGTDTDTGVYYPAANQVALATNGTLALMVDANRNIGLKVTPNASWPSSWSVLETIGGNNLWGVGGQVQIGYNNYYDGSAYKYAGTYRASRALFTDSGFAIESSPVGAAGGTVTFEAQLQVQYQNTVALRGAAPQSGTGITFPATQSASSNANTLDDYEEGSWTPVVGGTATYIAQSGTYVKIGRFVYVDFLLRINAIGTGSSTIMTGLPFVAGSGNSPRSSGSIAYAAAIASNVYSLSINADGNGIQFEAFTSLTNGTVDNISVWQNNAYIIGSATYYTNA
jgi:hypothetical protein